MDRGMGGEQIGSLAAMPWASITFWVGKACAKDENRDMAGHARGAPRCSRFGVGGGDVSGSHFDRDVWFHSYRYFPLYPVVVYWRTVGGGAGGEGEKLLARTCTYAPCACNRYGTLYTIPSKNSLPETEGTDFARAPLPSMLFSPQAHETDTARS